MSSRRRPPSTVRHRIGCTHHHESAMAVAYDALRGARGSPGQVPPGPHLRSRPSARTEYEGEGSFVTDTTDLAATPAGDESPRRSGGLSTMRLAELQGLASSLGLSGTAKMRKGDLVTAIRARQSGAPVATAQAPAPAPASTGTATSPASPAPVQE